MSFASTCARTIAATGVGSLDSKPESLRHLHRTKIAPFGICVSPRSETRYRDTPFWNRAPGKLQHALGDALPPSPRGTDAHETPRKSAKTSGPASYEEPSPSPTGRRIRAHRRDTGRREQARCSRCAKRCSTRANDTVTPHPHHHETAEKQPDPRSKTPHSTTARPPQKTVVKKREFEHM